jgi:methionyl-tRNA formyltransferase
MVAAPLRLVFFGTPAFAVPTLEALLASPHRVIAVVTPPDRPRGRGQRPSAAPVKARAMAAGVAILQPQRLKDPAFTDAFAALDSDLGVVAAYGKVLPEWLIAAPRLGTINVHASLLPRYRGAAPVHRAILAGERETGVTIMRVVKALDAGPMLASEPRAIGPDETSVDVEADLAQRGARLLIRVIDRLASGSVQEMPQTEAAATYAPRLTREDGIVNWARPALAIHNQIRGLHPWPHAYSHLMGRRYILLRSQVLDGTAGQPPGVIVVASGDRLDVATGAGAIRLLEIQPEGKRALSAREFLAGHRIGAGDAFS